MSTIADLLPDFVRYMRDERQLEEQTIRNYLSDLRQVDKFLGGKAVESITLDDLRAFVRHLKNEGRARNTIKRKIHTMSSFYLWLNVLGIVDSNVAAKVLRLLPRKERKQNYVWLSEDELRVFVTTPAETVRDQCAFALLAWLGLRRAELLGLRVGDFRLDEDKVLIRGKGRAERIMPVPGVIKPLVQALSMNRGPADYLLRGLDGGKWSPNSFGKVFHRHVKRCGFEKHVTPHVLRHTFATHLVRKGTPLATVRDLMGHVKIDTTAIYAHHSPQHLEDAMKNHPLSGENTQSY
jgi:site-specific recombinase XerD